MCGVLATESKLKPSFARESTKLNSRRDRRHLPPPGCTSSEYFLLSVQTKNSSNSNWNDIADWESWLERRWAWNRVSWLRRKIVLAHCPSLMLYTKLDPPGCQRHKAPWDLTPSDSSRCTPHPDTQKSMDAELHALHSYFEVRASIYFLSLYSTFCDQRYNVDESMRERASSSTLLCLSLLPPCL